MQDEQQWWKEAVVYQIYPRSFKDSNGDGIGDLRGIISKLDYIESLGIDVVWLNPIFKSPNDDNGYDISDYEAIMDEFGTMADFEELLQGLHDRGIKLILDLVVNHSSDEHEWFKQSRSSRDNPYRDYYHWWPAEKGAPPPRFSFLDVDQDAWLFDEPTNAYYLHYFSRKQPDLNWENPMLREEIHQMVSFWLKKGIDGFRMDVILFISKDIQFPIIDQAKLDKEYNGSWPYYYTHGPHLHQYLQELHKEVLSSPNIMTVGEAFGVSAQEALDLVDADRKELNMIYHFEAMDIKHLPEQTPAPDPKFDLIAFKDVHSKWDNVFTEKGWGTIYLGNHDQPRMVSRWGNDSVEFRRLSAKMLNTFILTMRGTPYCYAGDELAMTSIQFDSIEDYKDILTINRYRKIESEGGDAAAYLAHEKIYSRDNGRTPFQWDGTKNAGFTTGDPWLKINSDYALVNAEAEEKDNNSVLNYFKKLIQLRKRFPVLVYGKYALLDKHNPMVYAFTRQDEQQKILVILNFSAKIATASIGIDILDTISLLCNYSDAAMLAFKGQEIILRPYEAAVFQYQ